MWIASCFFLCLVAGSRQMIITEFGVPTALAAGKNAELQCQYSLEQNEKNDASYVKWWWTPLDTEIDKKKQLYIHFFGKDPELSQEFNKTDTEMIIAVKENDTIVISDLQPKHSGTYECEVSGYTEDRRHRELIVYTEGTGPILNTSLVSDDGDALDADSEDDVLITCEASEVAPEPKLYITVGSEQLEIEPVMNFTDGLYYIAVNATLSETKVDGEEIRCEMFYKREILSPHIVYQDKITYKGAETTTVPQEDDNQAAMTESAPETLKNLPGGGSSQLGSSWCLLLAAAITAYSKTALCT